MKVCVLGGGIAGLTSIWALSRIPVEVEEVVLIEKNDQLGGLCRTRKIGSKFYDFGPHIFHSRDDLILKEFRPKLENAGFYQIKTKAKSFWKGEFYDYPISVDNIFKLPPHIGKQVIVELYNLCPDNLHRASSFEEYVKNLLGETLYNIFSKDYASKIWGVKPSEIPADWAPKKMSFRVDDKTFFGKDVWEVYHREGIETVIKLLLEEIKDLFGNQLRIRLNTSAERILYDHGEYDILLNNGVEEYCDFLISSIPLDKLLMLLGEKPKPLEYLSSMIIYLELAREFPVLPANWIYLNEKKYPITRIFEYPSIIPNYSGNTWITVEYHINRHRNVENSRLWEWEDEKIVRHTVRYLQQLGIANEEDIITWDVWKSDYTYPVLTFETKANLEYNLKLAKKFKNLVTVGRLGKFKYMYMDETIVDTVQEVMKTFAGGANY